jgi:hypothetical protein
MMNLKICAWCINQNRERCLTICAAEGSYRYLEPVTLEDWELPPTLPSFRELAEMRSADKLALIYLGLYYIEYSHARAL